MANYRNVVVENNSLEDSDLGILITKRNQGIFLHVNTFKNVNRTSTMSEINDDIQMRIHACKQHHPCLDLNGKDNL